MRFARNNAVEITVNKNFENNDSLFLIIIFITETMNANKNKRINMYWRTISNVGTKGIVGVPSSIKKKKRAHIACNICIKDPISMRDKVAVFIINLRN